MPSQCSIPLRWAPVHTATHTKPPWAQGLKGTDCHWRAWQGVASPFWTCDQISTQKINQKQANDTNCFVKGFKISKQNQPLFLHPLCQGDRSKASRWLLPTPRDRNRSSRDSSPHLRSAVMDLHWARPALAEFCPFQQVPNCNMMNFLKASRPAQWQW